MLDRCSQNALNANSVAAHDRCYLFAISIEDASTHGFGILVAELKDVTDFDRCIDAQRTAAVRASFPCLDIADIRDGGVLKIAAGGHVLEVIVKFVGAADHVLTAFQSLIQHDRDAVGCAWQLLEIGSTHSKPHRTNKSARPMKIFFQLFCLHRAQFGRAQQGQQLGLVDGVVPA